RSSVRSSAPLNATSRRLRILPGATSRCFGLSVPLSSSDSPERHEADEGDDQADQETPDEHQDDSDDDDDPTERDSSVPAGSHACSLQLVGSTDSTAGVSACADPSRARLRSARSAVAVLELLDATLDSRDLPLRAHTAPAECSRGRELP